MTIKTYKYEKDTPDTIQSHESKDQARKQHIHVSHSRSLEERRPLGRATGSPTRFTVVFISLVFVEQVYLDLDKLEA